MRKGKSNVGTVIGIVAVLLVGFIVYNVAWLMAQGTEVKIPGAHVGKVKSSSGFEPKFQLPKIFRLPHNWFGLNPTKLVIAQVSDNRVVEPIEKLYMPKDDLNLEFEVVGTFAVGTSNKMDSDEKFDEAQINAIFDRMKPQKAADNDYVWLISFEQVYDTYGRQVVRTVAQEVVTQYTISHVLEHLDEVAKEVQREVNLKLKSTPIHVTYCGFGNIEPPKLIVDAEAQAKEREIAKEKAEADKQVKLVVADADYQVGLLQQKIDLVEAETQVLADLVMSDAVSQAYVAQRSLRALNSFANNPNATFLLSTKIFRDPASLLGFAEAEVKELDRNNAETQERLQKALSLIEESKKEALREIEKAKQEAEIETIDSSVDTEIEEEVETEKE